jgi:hypothetical protein
MLRPGQIESISNAAEKAFRGTSMSKAEAMQIATNILHTLSHCVSPDFDIRVDPDLPHGTLEMRYGNQVVCKMVNITP